MDYPLIFSSVADVGSNIGPDKLTGVSSLTFDTEQEILWVGNYSGHLTSFVPNSSSYNNLVKYTSFHIDYESDIRQLSTCRDGVLSLTKTFVRMSKRRGLPQFTHKSDLFKDLQCMHYKNTNENKSGHIYLAGNQEKLIDCDMETLKHVRVVNIGDDKQGISDCKYMKGHPKFMCLADGEGKIVLRDADMLNLLHEFKPTSPISSFDVCGNYLVTCSAYSQLLMIYDIREMKLVSATQTYLPMHLKFLSRFTTKCCIVSRNGQFSIVDLTSPSNVNQINNIALHSYGAEISAFDVSATDQAFAFGDNHNFVYVHGTCDKFHINTNPKQAEYADVIMPPPYYSLTSDCYTPVSEISQFPYYAFSKLADFRNLVSHMPSKQCIRTYRPTPPIGPDILRSMKVVGNIGYVVNPSGMMPSLNTNANNSRRNSPEGNEFGTDQMPHRYHFLEPNHNMVDKDEYDFSRFNHSPFPGLDSTMPNSYANNMIQCLYFIPPLRSAIESHICGKEYCLICELGFLFHMLDTAPKHTPCQASNFLRAFRTIPEVSAFKLILPEDETLLKQVNFRKLSQQWLRFLLHQLNRESSNTPSSPQQPGAKNYLNTDFTENSKASFVTDYFSLRLTRNFQCIKCRHTWQSPHDSFPVTLNYPFNQILNNTPTNGESSAGNGSNQSGGTGTENVFVGFAELLTNSILTRQTIQAFCSQCQKFHHNITEKRIVSSLPNIFAINTGLDNERAIKFWQNQISQFSTTSKNKGKYVITNLEEVEKNKQKQPEQSKTITQTGANVKACRYGQNCMRSDCKFYHAHLENENENELNAHGQFASWIPPKLYIVNGDNGLFEIKDKCSDCLEGQVNEYCLINVTSVVKSDENSFDNIVSAIKIDKAYFCERKKQLMKKRRRHMRTNNETMVNQDQLENESDLSDSDELPCELEDNQMFTLDSRSCLNDFEKNILSHDTINEWYLFNHYSINPISIEEVLSTDLSWKIPATLMYIRSDLIGDMINNKTLRRIKNQIDPNVLSSDISVALKIQSCLISFVPLDLSKELLRRGDIVAMDAEFVMLNHEETELRSDGTRSTIKPSHKSVARISCVRGSGQMQGIPFIDDYICTQDQVADYMTKFSGIKPGDLDATLSSKHLTTLKSTYLKLRFLVDNGVIFVGHGLRNDFRVINLVVPPEQVIDTVYLFQSPNYKRKVSLRFLAWHFLGLNIQSETHDSVEDAKTALALYHKYKELETTGCAQEAIEELYKAGKDCGWKVDY